MRMSEGQGEFRDRVALVTGGGRGIGRASAMRLAAAGASVAVNYRCNHDAAEAVVADIQTRGGRALAIAADVGDRAAVGTMVAEVAASLGPIDLLVTSAGASPSEGRGGPDAETWAEVMRVNLDGVYHPVMAVKDAMVMRRYGRIVTISSIAGLRPRPHMVAYATAKAAVIAFTRNISGLLAPDVRINSVAPGLIETDMIEAMNPTRREEMIQATPLLRLGQAAEIADAAFFLLSDASRFTTGQTLVASGGRVTLP